ncbi:MAG: hypothetical protein ACYS74_21625 [Planctomycetota bacterium]|jgi:hypothetical protein
MKQSGMFWHVHHDKLLEYCYSYDERVAFIKRHKDSSEINTRLRLFQPVIGDLPRQILEADKAWTEACKAYTEAREAYAEARKACDETYKACDEAWKACDEAWKARDEARKACDEAREACADEINQLHTKECPDCPWDGREIVFNKE